MPTQNTPTQGLVQLILDTTAAGCLSRVVLSKCRDRVAINFGRHDHIGGTACVRGQRGRTVFDLVCKCGHLRLGLRCLLGGLLGFCRDVGIKCAQLCLKLRNGLLIGKGVHVMLLLEC